MAQAIATTSLFGSPFAPPDSLEFVTHCKFSVQTAMRDKASADKSMEQNVASLLKKERYKLLTYRTRRGHRGKVTHHPFTSWRQFCEAPEPDGLGRSPADIDALIAENRNALSLATKDAAEQRLKGGQPENLNADKGKTTVYNVHSRFPCERPSGNSRQAYIHRLRKAAEADTAQYQAVYDDVLAETITPHKGMVLAGFKKALTNLEAARKALGKCTPAERHALITEAATWEDD